MNDGENNNRYEYLTGLPITFLQCIHSRCTPNRTIARIRGSGADMGMAGMQLPVKNPVTATMGQVSADADDSHDAVSRPPGERAGPGWRRTCPLRGGF